MSIVENGLFYLLILNFVSIFPSKILIFISSFWFLPTSMVWSNDYPFFSKICQLFRIAIKFRIIHTPYSFSLHFFAPNIASSICLYFIIPSDLWAIVSPSEYSALYSSLHSSAGHPHILHCHRLFVTIPIHFLPSLFSLSNLALYFPHSSIHFLLPSYLSYPPLPRIRTPTFLTLLTRVNNNENRMSCS